jgi:signal transduction histidine kinase
MTASRKQFWRYVRGLAPPLLLWSLFVAVLVPPLKTWLQGDDKYDEATMREWVEEARSFRLTLREMSREYLKALDRIQAEPDRDFELRVSAEEMAQSIQANLNAMAAPLKVYSGQLPGFVIIYRMAMTIEEQPGVTPRVIAWDSDLPRHQGQYRELTVPIDPPRVELDVQYQMHAYNKRQQNEQVANQRMVAIGVLTFAGTAVATLWLFLVQMRERERQRQRALAQQRLDQTEHLRLQEELRRRGAEQRQEEAERKLLEQRFATQAAERRALELKSQLYASIGIMAGSYAHNIKNLLVRPNDLLCRCLEEDGLSQKQEYMLREVRQTLGTVTERLQQILRTVRRDPSRSEMARLDLNAVVRDLQHTWEDLAREKWKLTLTTEGADGPLWIEGDLSHLQQAVENLLFNARDATFEMRNHLRDQAHRQEDLSLPDRQQALIAAVAWRGRVVLRTYRHGDRAILEVRDNGIGMTEEVRRRCTETHFSTKRNNAVYEGHTTGMGLGLSFVVVILEHHRATLEIASEPLQGALMRVSFPLAVAATAYEKQTA